MLFFKFSIVYWYCKKNLSFCYLKPHSLKSHPSKKCQNTWAVFPKSIVSSLKLIVVTIGASVLNDHLYLWCFWEMQLWTCKIIDRQTAYIGKYSESTGYSSDFSSDFQWYLSVSQVHTLVLDTFLDHLFYRQLSENCCSDHLDLLLHHIMLSAWRAGILVAVYFTVPNYISH